MNTGGANQFKVLFKNLLFDSIVCQKSLPTRSLPSLLMLTG